eukprot:tig00020965_g16867.t1
MAAAVTPINLKGGDAMESVDLENAQELVESRPAARPAHKVVVRSTKSSCAWDAVEAEAARHTREAEAEATAAVIDMGATTASSAAPPAKHAVRVFGRTPAPARGGWSEMSMRLRGAKRSIRHELTNPARADATMAKKRPGAPHIGWDLHTQRNIVRYDASSLFNWAFLQMRTATVVTWRLVLEALFLCGVATVFGYYRCEPARSDTRPGPRNFDGWTICVPLENSQALTLASLAAFLLSLFTSLIFSRYWQLRNLLQQMFGRTNRMASQLYAIVDTSSEEGLTMVNDIIRYMHLALALFHKQARLMGKQDPPRSAITDEPLPDPKRYDDLVREGLMTEEELALLKPVNNKWQICFGWAMCILRELFKQTRFQAAPPNMCFGFQRDLVDAQYAAGEALGIMSTPIPYAYAHLLSVMTKFHLVFITLYGASVIGVGFLNMQAERIVLGYLIISFNVLIFEGILLLYVELDNPMGFDPADFPVMNYRKSALADTSAAARLLRTQLPAAVAQAGKPASTP